MSNQRKKYLDLVKTLAIAFVIYNHTGQEGFLSFIPWGNTFSSTLKVILSVLCKTAVPLFFMCSGALLLSKEEKILDILKKRVLKYIIILILFSLLYYTFLVLIEHGTFSLKWIITYIYGNTTMYYSGAYWFLYSYIVFLLILPFLRLIIKDIQKKYIYYLLGICFLFQIIIPIFEKIFNLSPIALNISWLTSSIFLYPILGYYIDTMLVTETKMDKFVIVFPGIISFLCSITSSILGAIKDTFDESKLSIAGVFLTLLIFYGCKIISQHISIGKLISETGKSSFGIYLLHGYAFVLINMILPLGHAKTAMIRATLVFVTSFIASSLLRRIPLFKKLL